VDNTEFGLLEKIDDTASSKAIEREADLADRPRAGKKRRRIPMRRLNLNLPETLYQDIEQLAAEQGRSMADVLRIGLGLAYLVSSERKNGGHFAIIDAEGQLHKIILPY